MKRKDDFTADEWERGKREMCEILKRFARLRSLITYSELVEELQEISLEPNDPTLATMLGEISTEENELGNGMLSAVVVHKGDRKPGPGFFALARRLGYDVPDNDTFWNGERDKLHTR